MHNLWKHRIVCGCVCIVCACWNNEYMNVKPIVDSLICKDSPEDEHGYFAPA